MTWEKFLKDILNENQIEKLRLALARNKKIVLYGNGIGKTTLSKVLKSLGYDVKDIGNCRYINKLAISDDFVSFELGKRPKELIANVYDQLLDEVYVIENWIY